MGNTSGRLFRNEAVAHQRNNWAGKAMLISRIPPYVIGLFTLFFLISLILFITYGNYTRRITTVGDVTTYPHAIDIFSPQQGYITKQFVNVGDTVKAGDNLYQIDVDRMTSSGTVGARKIGAINEQISQINQIIGKLQKNKDETLKNLRIQIEHYEEATKQSKSMLKDVFIGVKNMRQNMNEYDKYRMQGLINKDQLNNQRYTFYQQQSVYHSLNTQYITNSLQLTNLQSEVTTKAADFDNQISQYELQREDMMRQLTDAEAGNSILVKAPTDGKVESLSVTQGQMVTDRGSLAQLTQGKNRKLYLVLWVPNDALPYLAKGDKVNIRYDAFPFEKFGQFPGKIESISSVPASVAELSEYKNSPLNINNGKVASYYKALIDIKNSDIKYNDKTLLLSNGMKAQATLFLEKRPVYQWMLSPFYDMKRSIMGPINE